MKLELKLVSPQDEGADHVLGPFAIGEWAVGQPGRRRRNLDFSGSSSVVSASGWPMVQTEKRILRVMHSKAMHSDLRAPCSRLWTGCGTRNMQINQPNPCKLQTGGLPKKHGMLNAAVGS